MTQAPKTKAGPEAPKGSWHLVRKMAAGALFVGAAACLLYGGWLGLRMHLSKAMPGWAVGHVLVCAVLAAMLYTVCVRIEPLPARRKRRGNRWINVETPTARQIWETAPGDFVEAMLAAVGIMTAPALFLLTLGSMLRSSDFADFIIAVAIGGGAFALEGAFVSWRGRGMFDPPGQVRKAAVEPERESAKVKARDIDIYDDD